MTPFRCTHLMAVAIVAPSLLGGCASTCGDAPAAVANGTRSAMSSAATAASASAADTCFLAGAARDGLAEVRFAKLATEKATNAKVKELAEAMLADFQKSNEDLRQVAAGIGLTLPTDLDSRERWDYRELARQDGMYFHRYYVNMVAEYHIKEVRQFRHEAAHATDPAVRHFAAATVHTLRVDRDKAQDLIPFWGIGRTFGGDVPQ